MSWPHYFSTVVDLLDLKSWQQRKCGQERYQARAEEDCDVQSEHTNELTLRIQVLIIFFVHNTTLLQMDFVSLGIFFGAKCLQHLEDSLQINLLKKQLCKKYRKYPAIEQQNHVNDQKNSRKSLLKTDY